MRNKNFQLLISVGMIIIGLSCRNVFDKSDPRKIKLINSSTQSIIFYRAVSYDSSWPSSVETYWQLTNELASLLPNTSKTYSVRDSWENIINNYVTKKIPIYIVNKDSVVKYAGSIQPWPHTLNDMLKSWTLDIDSFMHYNWVLTYP
jgi:predicted P-loop ATPase